MDDCRIRDLEHYLGLLRDVNAAPGEPSWDHMLPYYHEDIHFKDAVQEIRGMEEFSLMTKRLAKRSRNLEMVVHSSCMQDTLIFVEWEMIISYKRFPKSSVYGLSRVTLKDGKIFEQRDYYDLWGDIADNIGFLAKGYRRFMRKRFG
jgi:hypothetical protein